MTHQDPVEDYGAWWVNVVGSIHGISLCLN